MVKHLCSYKESGFIAQRPQYLDHKFYNFSPLGSDSSGFWSYQADMWCVHTGGTYKILLEKKS